MKDTYLTSDPDTDEHIRLLESAGRDVQASSWAWAWAKALRSLTLQKSIAGFLYCARSSEALGESSKALRILLQALETDALRPELWGYCLRLLRQTGASEANIASAKRALVAALPSQSISGSNVPKPLAIVCSKQIMRCSDGNDIVNIIIPIFDGFEQTKACIESVIKNTKHKSYHLVLVDDASPNQQIKAWLHDLNTDKRYTERITLITHSVNQGFIGAVNRGLALNPERDVVLLNADTTVSGNWLVRLKAAAYSAPDIGTVTPLSNNAEQLSYPYTHQPTNAPNASVAAQIDALLERLNHAPVTIPMGVGFCLYVRKDCRAKVGYLSEAGLVRGYGEDSDYCLRVVENGYRNVCAPNVFVAHQGEVSFSFEKKVLAQINLKTLYQRYPQQPTINAKFIQANPLERVRREIDRARFIQNKFGEKANRVFLILNGVSLSQDQEQLYYSSCRAAGIELWTISAERHKNKNYLRIGRAQFIDPNHLLYDWEVDQVAMMQDLQHLGIKQCIVIGEPYRSENTLASKLKSELRLPTKFYVHAIPLSHEHLQDITAGDTFVCASPEVEHYLKLTAPQIKIERAPWYAQLKTPKAPSKNQSAHYRGVFIHPNDTVAYKALLQYSRYLAVTSAHQNLLVLGATLGDQALIRTGKAWVTGEIDWQATKDHLKHFECADTLVIEHRIDADQLARRKSLVTGLPSTWLSRKPVRGNSSDDASAATWLANTVKSLQLGAVA